MMRLIDADALKEKINTVFYSQIGKIIDDAPTIDAVEVVRCKDCKHLSVTTLGMEYACWHDAYQIYGETGANAGKSVCRRIDDPYKFYCAFGERSNDEQKK